MDKLITQSASLRGLRQFEKAINLIEDNLYQFNDHLLLNAYLEIVYAAEEGNLHDYLKKYIPLLRMLDPNIPTVKKYPQF